MQIKETKLQGSFIIQPTVFGDDRGNFFESFNKQVFEQETGVKTAFVQDNQSISNRGVLRGLHFQKGQWGQSKLVRVIQGKVLDIIIDIRPGSITFGEHLSFILSAENNRQIYLPKGFAHGFSVLEDNTIFAYKCDNYYNKESESGILFNDPKLAIDWHLEGQEIQLSPKDKILPLFKDIDLD